MKFVVVIVILTALTTLCFGIKCKSCVRDDISPDPNCVNVTTEAEECETGWCIESFITSSTGLYVSRRCINQDQFLHLRGTISAKCHQEGSSQAKGDVCYCNTNECNSSPPDKPGSGSGGGDGGGGGGGSGGSGCGKTKSMSLASWAVILVTIFTGLLSIPSLVP